MNESLLNGFLIFSILQSFFFALLFFAKKNKSISDRIIGIWLLLLATQSFIILVSINNENHSLLKIFPVNITLLYGPLLFIYVSKISSEKQVLKFVDLFHFAPFILFGTISILLSQDVLFFKILSSSSVLSGILYCIITFRKLQKHKKRISDSFSYLEKINLSWISKLVIGFIIIWIGVFVLVFLKRLLGVSLSLTWFFIIIPLFISYIGYYGVKQQAIYSTAIVEPEKTINKVVGAYKKSGLKPDNMKAIYDKLQQVMVNEQLYLHPTLNLLELSRELNIQQHHITQTLNDYAKQNFNDYVNSYRIKAFKERLENGNIENFSLLGIALDCGFNSKSSFNRIFKNNTRLTPSEYKKGLCN